ncbi:hypothetical protein KRP22_002586 [Phytophthora ramorum]|nr:hypothetical protein KRP22_6233 [Phytophthora ramorum]
MAQETEPVAAALESPSPSKRRNRKKGRHGSTTEDHDEDEEQDAATDLISLPSPVAASSSDDIFAMSFETTSVEQAMDHLALAKETQEDALLQLPSGRLPLTPPPTPEPFLVHSPEKGQAQVAPLTVEARLLPTVEEVEMEVASELPMKVKSEADAEQEEMIEQMAAVDVADASVEPPMELSEHVEDAVVEQEAAVLSSTLADLTLYSGTMLSVEHVESIEMSETAVDAASAASPQNVEKVSPVADDHVETTKDNAKVKLITAESIEYTAPEVAVSEPTAMVVEVSPTENLVAIKQTPVEIPVVTEHTLEEVKLTEPTPAQTPVAKEAAPTPQKEESKTLPEASPSPRRNKRKGDSPGQQLHTAPTEFPKPFAQAHQDEAVPLTSSESGRKLKQVAAKDSAEFQVQSRTAKRKGDVSDVKPPPAPAAKATKEIRPKRLVARTSSGPMLNKTKKESEAKCKPEVAARPVHDAKKDSMMNPTASSIARATAAEARKALLKGGAAKKAPTRKPTRTRLVAKSAGPTTTLPAQQASVPPPAPVAADDGERNVKRRLNAIEVEAASRRLYDDAKEAKLRKDARRAELTETYTFAPQVNNFKRRTTPGESEDLNLDHFSRLHAQAKELQGKKRDLQQQHERDGCTFAPTISARAKRLSQKSSAPRYENLYKNAQEIKLKREEKLMEKAKTTEEECPFKPKITASKSPVKTKPLYDSEREKQKRLALQQKKIEAEMSECTFKPKVTAKRLKVKAEEPSDLPTDSAAEANPYNRLYQASIERAERLQKLRQDRDEEEKAQAPFQPKITTRSRVAKGQAKAKQQPFHKRLYNKDYMKKLDAEREQRRLEEEQQFTFKPEINEPPAEIKVKVNERASPRKSIFERLYDEKDKMKEKIELSEELRLHKEMAECTFRPQIEADAVQSNGGTAPPVWERLLSYDKAQVIEEREKLKEQLEMQECTFKPEVKSSDPLSMNKSPSFNVFDRLTGSGSNSSLDPTRPSFITRRPSSSPGRQSPDTKGVSIGRIIKTTKFALPAERKMLSRTYSISQPSSVNKQVMKRSTSFSGPKSASSSPTMSMGDVISRLQTAAPTPAANGDATQLHSLAENYDSWSAELDAKLRHL